jgi:glycosyltransferase involved in cell wall biosynthesis
VLRDQAETLGLAARVNFAGSLDRGRIYDLIDRCGIVIMPSRIEPFGLVALEAAQRARPVIAAAVDGLPEVVRHGETGLLVPPDDVTALAAAIAELATDPDRARRLGAQAYRHALEFFRWEGFVGAYEDVLTRIARK